MYFRGNGQVSSKICVYFYVMVMCCFLAVDSMTKADSVFAISRHTDSTVQGYGQVDGGPFDLYYNDQLPANGSGAIDLAISENDDLLFASYDGANIIEVVNAKTMEPVATEFMSGGTENEIAGMDFCSASNCLLAAERYDSNIRILEYDPVNKLFTKNVEVQMPTVTGGILGVCVDEVEMRIYISQSQDVVKYFDFLFEQNEPNLVYGGEIPIEWDGQSRIAVGIAVYNDGAGTKYLYSTGYNHENANEHPYIIRTSLTASNQVDLNAPGTIDGRVGVYMGPFTFVAGVDVDPATGTLFAATLGSLSSVQVYDTLTWTSDPNTTGYTQLITNNNLSGPAGIVYTLKDYWTSQLYVHKEQVIPDPNIVCVEPNELVTYKIAFHQGKIDEYNVVVREILADQTAFVSAVPDTGFYDSLTHTYAWDIGNLPGLDPNGPTDPNLYFEITVQVLDAAPPGGKITNWAEVESDNSYAEVLVDTLVCCWDPGIIYVDKNAAGYNSGINWENAYVNLNKALTRASQGCGSEIWVAQGTYLPGNAELDTFQVPENMTIYGGFNGTETARSQRNWAANGTILAGIIDEEFSGEEVRNQVVVTMADQSQLDGFTVKSAQQHGIKGENADFSIHNCIVENNWQSGIYSSNGDLTVTWSRIANNLEEGIHHSGDGDTLLVMNSKIYNNQQDGIYADSSVIQVDNSLIYRNGLSSGPEDTYYGINVVNTDPNYLIVHNNTIVSNTGEGIYFAGWDPPDILNCILWNNAGKQIAGFDLETAVFYSCVQDCNDVNFNLSSDPDFAYGYPNVDNENFHLAYNSPCVNAGDPNSPVDPNKFDLDGEPRIYGISIDIGADEVYACDDDLTADDVYNPLDLSADGLINNSEFVPFSVAWLSHDPNDPAITTDPNDMGDPNYVDPETFLQWQQFWNPIFDLDTTLDSQYNIDMADLKVFCNDYWFWTACWKWNEISGSYLE